MSKGCLFLCNNYTFLFDFPKKGPMLDLWRKKLSIQNFAISYSRYKLCDRHFSKKDILWNSLKPNAVPMSKSLWSKDDQQQQNIDGQQINEVKSQVAEDVPFMVIQDGITKYNVMIERAENSKLYSNFDSKLVENPKHLQLDPLVKTYSKKIEPKCNCKEENKALLKEIKYLKDQIYEKELKYKFLENYLKTSNEMFEKSKEKIKDLSEKIVILNTKNEKLLNDITELHMKALIPGPNTTENSYLFSKIICGKNTNYNNKVQQLISSLYTLSPKVYRFMKTNLAFKLPCGSTVLRWKKQIKDAEIRQAEARSFDNKTKSDDHDTIEVGFTNYESNSNKQQFVPYSNEVELNDSVEYLNVEYILDDYVTETVTNE